MVRLRPRRILPVCVHEIKHLSQKEELQDESIPCVLNSRLKYDQR